MLDNRVAWITELPWVAAQPVILSDMTIIARLKLHLFAAASLTQAVLNASAAPVIDVQADQPGAPINPAMWGVFFEDINIGADGGLYAELVKNRGFEFPDPLMGWTKISPSLAKGDLSVREDNPFNPNNPHYVRLQSEGTAHFGISNEGFRGMGIHRDETYHFSAQLRAISGSPTVRLDLMATTAPSSPLPDCMISVATGNNIRPPSEPMTPTPMPAWPSSSKIWAPSMSTSYPCFHSILGKTVPVVFGRIWFRPSPGCTPASSAFPAAASSKAACCPAVINGRIPSVPWPIANC